MQIFDAPDLQIYHYVVGSMATNTYFLVDPLTSSLTIIDPGNDGDFLSEEIIVHGFKLNQIVLTHGHFDHAGGSLPLILNFPHTHLLLHENDLNLYLNSTLTATHFGIASDPLPPPTHLLTHDLKTKPKSQKLPRQNMSEVLPSWQTLFIPGHTQGSLGFYHPTHHLLISGDVIFGFGSVGRTDFPYSDSDNLALSIKTKILSLPLDTTVLPGHEVIFTLDQENKNLLKEAVEYF